MEQLKRLRTERNLSQTKLAQLADLNPATVNQIEKGAREASTATLRKLAEALDVGLAELLEDDSPKAQAPLPFEEQEQRRCRFLVSWGRFMRRRARYWEQVLEEEEREGLFVGERILDATLWCEAVQNESLSIFETLAGVYRDLDKAGPPTKTGQAAGVELMLAAMDLLGVTRKWSEKTEGAWATATGGVEEPKLARSKERTAEAIKARENVVAMFPMQEIA